MPRKQLHGMVDRHRVVDVPEVPGNFFIGNLVVAAVPTVPFGPGIRARKNMRTARSVSLAATSSVAAIPSTTTAISWATVFLIGSRPLRIASRPKTWKHQCRRPRERARHAGYRHGPDQVTRPPSGEWNVGSSRHRAPVLREGRESVNIHTNSGFSRGMSGEHAMKVQAYLSFEGRCGEAIIEFYKRVLGAEVLMVMRFKDAPEPPSPGMIAPGSENNILTSPGNSASRKSKSPIPPASFRLSRKPSQATSLL